MPQAERLAKLKDPGNSGADSGRRKFGRASEQAPAAPTRYREPVGPDVRAE
jgi:hypothetical protein